MKQETVTLTKQEYELLKKKANLDLGILYQLMGSLKDIKEGSVRRVK